MNRSRQANAAVVSPSRGGCEYKVGCDPKRSKSLRQLIDERLSQSQRKTMGAATTPTPKVIAPVKTAITDSPMGIPHPHVSMPVDSRSRKSARMQRRKQARQRQASPSPSCSSSAQMQRRQEVQQRHASPSPSCSSTSVTSYSIKVIAPNDNHSHSAATVCSASSVSSCSMGTSLRVLAENKRQKKESMKNTTALEHHRMATSRVGKHLSIPTTAALQSSVAPVITDMSVLLPIATAVAQSRNQNHLMSRYSATSPQKQRPQRRQPENAPAQQRKPEQVYFDFEDNKIIPTPTTTNNNNNNNNNNIPRSHIKKPLAHDPSLKKRSDVLRKNTKNNTNQSPPLKSQIEGQADSPDSPIKSNKTKELIAASINDNKEKIMAQNKSSNNENKIMDNENMNIPPCGGRLSTALARSRRFQSWCDSRKQHRAAFSSGTSLSGE